MSWQFFAFTVLKPICPIAQDRDDSIGSLPIRAELALSEILLVTDDFSQDEVTNLKFPWDNFLVTSSGKLLLVYCELNCSFLFSFF